MTHEQVRNLLPAYAAGVLGEAESDEVRVHLSEGCVSCLEEVFSRPVGLPTAPETASRAVSVPSPAPMLIGRRVIAIAAILSLVFIAVAVSMVGTSGERPEALGRELAETQELRASLAARLAALERAAASAEDASREAAKTRAATDELRRQLASARFRIAALKRSMRRQDTDFHQKQQSLEAVIANLSRRVPVFGATGGAPGQTACARLAEPAREVCTVFCEVRHCDRIAAADCEALRGRFEEITGESEPPCAVAIGADALVPCTSTHVDIWSFGVKQGRRYTVAADTVVPGTAADLCLVGSCQGRDTFAADDDFQCRSAPAIGCPRATFTASADATCIVAVTVCSPGCGGRTSASYEVRVEGAESIALVADGASALTGEAADVAF